MKFRYRVLAGSLVLIVTVLLVALGVTQTAVSRSFDRLYNERFKRQMEAAEERDSLRLSQYRAKMIELASSVRILAALEDGEKRNLYQVAADELTLRGNNQNSFSFVKFLDEGGEMIESPKPSSFDEGIREHGSKLKEFFDNKQVDESIGLFPGGKALDQSSSEAVLVIARKVRDKVTSEVVGGLLLGFPYTLAPGDLFVFGEELYGIPLAQSEKSELASYIEQNPDMGDGGFLLTMREGQHMLFWTKVPALSLFNNVFRGALYSLEGSVEEKRDLLVKLSLAGLIALILAIVLSGIISRQLSGPLERLAEATVAVKEGDYSVRVPVQAKDEVGQLSSSFNSMTEQLALKEKYRQLLDIVADRKIADALLRDADKLGGELREISVLFCDVRGFTALTDGMPPQEVIEMLNEHMTALTKVVYKHGGVVDKFVGDLIMAIFGAPTSTADDAAAAVRCALEMIVERERLNLSSRYFIEMGIGIASGQAVAGCMGSLDRMNYTVLGDRVNLAARLCGAAGPMETIIDDNTRRRLAIGFQVEERSAQLFKGFSEPILTYSVLGDDGLAIAEVA